MQGLRNRVIDRVILLFAVLSYGTAQAGGPLLVSNGKAILWPPNEFPIVYQVDLGDLGPYPHEEAVQLIESSFSTWQSVPQTAIRFQRGDDIPEDVTETNAYAYLSGQKAVTNPVIFDDDGSIIQMLFGIGAENDVLGFGGPRTYSGGIITSAQAVFNGYAAQSMKLSKEAVYSTILHEIGHFIGLDHTQLFTNLAYNGVGEDDRYVSMMFPYAADDDSFRTVLTDEDQRTLASLYPDSTFSQTTGSLSGVVRRGTQELPGVNVIARRIGSTTDSVFTTVTGTYSKNLGDFQFLGLPPGTYQIGIEPIDTASYGSSSVGQYAETPSDRSFVNPPPMQAYHIDGTLASRSAWTPILISANQDMEGIAISAQSFNSPIDEIDSVLLCYDIPQAGAAPGTQSPYLITDSDFQFLLVPSGQEGSIQIQVQAVDPNSEFEIHASIEQRVSESGALLQQSQNGSATVLLGMGGQLDLASKRYFIDIRTRGTEDVSYTIQASIVATQTPSPTCTPSRTPTPTATLKPVPTKTLTPTLPPTMTPTSTQKPLPTPTAVEVNPYLGLVAIDEVGGTYPRGAAVFNFDIGITGKDGSLAVPDVYDGIPDPVALGPFLVFNHGFYPIAKAMKFSGERDPQGNGSEGIYFLIGGNLDQLPPVHGRLGATGGPHGGGIDTDNWPDNNISFGEASGDAIPIQMIQDETGWRIVDTLIDIEPAGNSGFYVLDQSGRIYAEGDALETLDVESPPADMNPQIPAVDLLLYRGRTIDVSNSLHSGDLIGTGAFILDRLGGIHSVGNVPPVDTAELPLVSVDSPIVYHELQWIPNSTGTEWIGLGALRGDGIIFFVPFADLTVTPDMQNYIHSLTPFGQLQQGFSFDIARGFDVEISDNPIYGKNAQGETIASRGRRIGTFMVDGFGGIHTGGRSTRYVPAFGATGADVRIINGETAVPYPINIPYFGVDVIQDLEIAPLINRSFLSTQSMKNE